MNKALWFIFSGLSLLFTSHCAYADESTAGYNLNLSFDPISFSSKDNERDIDYDISLSKLDTSTSDFKIDFHHTLQRTVDAYSNVSTTSNDAVLTIDFSLTPQEGIFSYTSEYIFEQSHEGSFYDKRYEGTVGPLGLKASFFRKSNIIETFSLSYLPQYNILKHDVFGSVGQTRIERSLHHKLALIYIVQLTKNFNIHSEVDWTYLIPNNDDTANVKDKKLSLDMRLNYTLSDHVSLTYQFRWENDERVSRLFNEEETESTHSLNITYSVDLFKN